MHRKQFSFYQKLDILLKSDCRCARCGIQLDAYSMTVEHAVPISLGGSNREVNLFALCKECNQFKGNTVVNPYKYYKYVPNRRLLDALIVEEYLRLDSN